MNTEPLPDVEQDEIVGALTTDIGHLTEEEFEDLYNQLDSEHQIEVNDAIRKFADDAVGDEHWDSDQ